MMPLLHRRVLLATLLTLPLSGMARAHSYKAGKIMIGHAWALPAQASDGQVFFPLVNSGPKADELVAARSPACSMVEIRSNNRYDDPPLASLKLDPGKPIPMRPTARHLRLIGLKKPLAEGDRFPLILDFLNAGEVEIEVMVEKTPGN